MRTSMMGLLAALVVGVSPALAQQQDAETDVDVRAGQTRVQVDAQQDDTARAQRRGARGANAQGTGLALRSTDLVGLEVRNMQDEELGEVQDLVIDLQSGRVRYVALSTGGVLGVGDKMFAVPWNAFRYRMQENEQYLVLNATAEKFENAPGFDDENWPDFADQQWRTSNDQFYREQGLSGRRGAAGRQGNQTDTSTEAVPNDPGSPVQRE